MNEKELQFVPQGTVGELVINHGRAEKHRRKLARKVKVNSWMLAFKAVLGMAAFLAVLAWANWNVPIELI